MPLLEQSSAHVAAHCGRGHCAMTSGSRVATQAEAWAGIRTWCLPAYRAERQRGHARGGVRARCAPWTPTQARRYCCAKVSPLRVAHATVQRRDAQCLGRAHRLIEPGMVLESLSASAGQSVSLKELSYDAALDALRKTGLPVCLNM